MERHALEMGEEAVVKASTRNAQITGQTLIAGQCEICPVKNLAVVTDVLTASAYVTPPSHHDVVGMHYMERSRISCREYNYTKFFVTRNGCRGHLKRCLDHL